MSTPFFYSASLDKDQRQPELDDDTMRHIVQVLRMRTGEAVRLTNGRGLIADAVIVSVAKKTCTVDVIGVSEWPAPVHHVCIAISPLKNPSRFEWFLEKATELGVRAFVPLLCARTEKQHVKADRWKNILVSSMLQSQQAWLPEFHDPVGLTAFLEQDPHGARFIAHCMEGDKKPLQQLAMEKEATCILIGPEGDFTTEEVAAAVARGFTPVSLGDTRLRTETAGITAAVLLTHPV